MSILACILFFLSLARSIDSQKPRDDRSRWKSHHHDEEQRHQKQHVGGADFSVECEMRSVAFEMAMAVAPVARKSAATIFRELQLDECDKSQHYSAVLALVEKRERRRNLGKKRDTSDASSNIYLDCSNGNDSHNGMSTNFALKTPSSAQIAAREMLSSTPTTRVVVHIVRSSTCYLREPLLLTSLDSNIDWIADKNVTFSAGVPLTNLQWRRYKKDRNVFVADLPDHVNASAIDSLFAHYEPLSAATVTKQARLVCARYPNGDSEVDQMPEGYTKFGGGVSSVNAWSLAHNVSVRFPLLKRNASIYPYFGHSRDSRWAMDYHTEDDNTSYYESESQFWRPTIATAAKYNATTFSPRVDNWTNIDEAILHVIHYDWWGNWQWKLQEINGTIMKFGKGGWQDAHGGPVIHNYFYVENILEELDTPGEWFVDSKERKLYYWPTKQHQHMNDSSKWAFTASQLPVIVHFQGTPQDPVKDVTFKGITFAHTTTTYLSSRYTVPSAGDWSVLPQGSITMDGARRVSLLKCNWIQISGNAIAMHGHVQDSRVEDGDFRKVGDSAIVVVGKLSHDSPYLSDETNVAQSAVPTNITITRNHFGQFGVFGKQTSALFVAISKRIIFENNVVYHGPRAGININDGFGGGHEIKNNVIFNQVLESGDHGPINTWSRSAYLYKKRGSKAHTTRTTIQEWSHIEGNMIILGPKMGCLYGPGDGPCSNGVPDFYCPKGGNTLYTCLDHDDGSDYYLDTRNVCVFFGMKNYLGQNKIWDNNFIVYPEGAASQNRTGMPCLWTSMYLPAKGNQSGYCNEKSCRTREAFTNNQCITNHQAPLEYDMLNLTDLQLNGPRNTTIPYTANNTYFLRNGRYSFTQWNLSETQRRGIDVGSKVHAQISAAQLGDVARRLLGVQALPRI
jgi:hypothetical protein